MGRLLELLTKIDGRASVEDPISATHAAFCHHLHGLEIDHGQVEGEGPGGFVVIGVNVRVALEVAVDDFLARGRKVVPLVVSVEGDVVGRELRLELADSLEPRGAAASTSVAVGDDSAAASGEV